MANGRFTLPGHLVAALCLVIASPWSVAGDATQAVPLAGDPAPAPELSPGEVVRIQLEALRANDADDHGIAVAFRFASPRNKASTGPLERFIRMIKAGPYRLMLHYQHASFKPVRIDGNRAVQRVTLVGRGEIRTYVFLLSRQRDPACDGCWMTDAVLLVPGPKRSV